ncbi:GNAT family N-acetyltransferase [Mariniflexile gromovii]|uniref:GNAT family N-acetyltransferase n=1 Tax=Mariniflexile gromovii TaxID=362523 RepID=A0ABS4BVF2_9FLAO|nr:GNAT family N-acetyltransferase [Mariniflexile gromovii]MBP0904060.1 GNAT family N-acetyltransferase [Mariniflexile gromovii]
MITFKTLEKTDLNIILDALNTAFSDYIIPLEFTSETFKYKLTNDRINLNYSVGAFQNGKLIAFILHGSETYHHKKILYNAGTGVIPNKRGQQLTTQLYNFIIPKFKEANISRIILEVITTNKSALKIYKNLGFKTYRTLHSYKGIVNNQPRESKYIIKQFEINDWEKIKTFWDFEPAWQNDIQAIEKGKKANLSLGVFEKDTLLGYVCFNPKNNIIKQFAVKNTKRRNGIASLLFDYLSYNYNSNFHIVNIESTNSSTIKFLENYGLNKVFSQYEMILNL